jgi:Flp pilus assembly protein CpaB
MPSRRFAALLVAVCFVGVLVWGYRLQAKMTATVSVLVAARDLPAQHRLDARDLKLVPVAPGLVPTDAIADPARAVGQYARSPLQAGDLIRTGKLTATPPQVSLAEQVPGDRRALSLAVVPSHVLGGALQPGDHVDVLAALAPARSGEPATARTLLQDVHVLDIRNQSAQPARESPPREQATSPGTTSLTPGSALGQLPGTLPGTGAGPIPATIVLEVTPEQATALVQEVAGGADIYLTLVGKGPAGDVP